MQINSILPLSEPFNSVTSFDINELDIHSQHTFSEDIAGQEVAEMPFFLALTEDKKGNIAAFNGFSFVHSYYHLKDKHSLSYKKYNCASDHLPMRRKASSFRAEI